MPNLIAVNGNLDNVWGRTERAHERRFNAILAMGPTHFQAFCWANKVGKYAPATSFAPQADLTGEDL